METPAFLVYNASAGSGKTYTLVKEYLKILLKNPNDDAYRKILAITFTNKAVAEMKKRVVDSLFSFSKATDTAGENEYLDEIAEELSVERAKVIAKSKAILKSMVHNYSGFSISTIDAFNHRIIRAFALDLKLPMPFKPSIENDLLLTESVDKLVNLAGEDTILTQVLTDFVLEKADADKSWDVTFDLKNIGKLISNENDKAEIELLKDIPLENFKSIKENLTTEIENLSYEISALADTILKKIEFEGINIESFSRKTFPNYIEKISNKEDFDNYKYVAEEDIKVNKNVPDQYIIEANKLFFIEILNQIYVLNAEKKLLDGVLKNITPLSLLQTLHKELKTLQEEQNIVAVSEFNTLINKEIKDQPTPFIYEQLGERYKHFFIDEFQDTSVMQWANLIPLIDNALSAQDATEQNGTLLLVGDPKQSIYRWRGGKPEQFIELNLTKNPFSNKDKETRVLDTNYRSFSEIINFNNAFFQNIAHEFENAAYKSIYTQTTQQKLNKKQGGYVKLTFIDPELDKEETIQAYLDETLATIKQCLASGFANKDMVILVRKRDNGVAVAKFLTENNIPIVSSETLLIDNSTEVKLLVNALKFLKNTKDTEAKALFLYFLYHQKNINIPIHTFINEGKNTPSEATFELFLKSFNLHFSFDSFKNKSLYELTEHLVNICIQPENNHAYVQYFLDLIIEQQVNVQANITDFLNYWDKCKHKKSIPSPEGNDAVKIMTIHQSKGLEFPVVIIPFAEEDYNRTPKDKIWLSTPDLELPKGLLNDTKEFEQMNPEIQELYKTRKEEKKFDQINVLYVALTRAEEQLHIITRAFFTKEGLQNNMSSYFVKYLQSKHEFAEGKPFYAFGNPEKSIKKEQKTAKQNYIEPIEESFDLTHIKIAQREAQLWGTERAKAISYGNIMHEILAEINTKTDIENAINQAISKGSIALDEKENFIENITKIVCNPALAPFFDAKNTLLTERSILQAHQPNQKPDRVVINGLEAYLLDYKTGKPEAYHTEQLENYSSLLETMGYRVVDKQLVYL